VTRILAARAVVGGSYELSELLGSGGMGQVWAARHRVTGREVAIKFLRASVDSDPDALARFQREARAACAVDHPNVVEILDFAERDGEEPMIVMERLRGETLADRLARKEHLSLDDTASLMVQAISAVGSAHALGIVHRDLKPSNIFIVRRARDSTDLVKVVDFGVAKWVNVQEGGPALRTKSGSTLGTPCYMAPEQALGKTPVDHRADVWALGVILYECLTGVRPVEGENSAQVIAHLLSTGIIPVEELAVDVPPEVAELVGKMLTRDASGRPSDLRQAFTLFSRYTSIVSPAFSEPSTQQEAPERERELDSKPPAPARTPAHALEPTVTLVRPELVTGIPTLVTGMPTATDHAPVRPSGQRRAARLFGLALVVGVVALLWLARARDSSDGAGPAAEPPPLVRPAPAEPARSATPVPAATSAATPEAPGSSPAVRPTRPPHTARAPSRRRSASPEAAAADSVVSPGTSGKVEKDRAPGLRAGEACEKSSDCESKKCVAFACQ
jgi:serine/threonine protein kinase